jgi:RHS repeat-associated protein
MHSTRSLSLVLVAFLTLTANAIAQADQTANFAPPLALYSGSDVDTVSLPMRNVRITIPLLHLKGRGLDFDVNATFNTVSWSTSTLQSNGLTEYDTEFSGGGWAIGLSRMGLVTGNTFKCASFDAQGNCLANATYVLFSTADGSVLQLGQDTPPGTAATRFWSNDGTYTRIPAVTFNGNAMLVPKIVYKDGVSLYQHYNAANFPDSSTLEDTNGNKISCSWLSGLPYPTVCTDTVGRIITFNYVPNTFKLSSISYLDSSGHQQVINFAWNDQVWDVPWANSQDNSDPLCTPGGAVVCYNFNQFPPPLESLLQTITLPNNRSYSFEYLTNSNGTTTGQITKFTLPTGGYVRYQYPCSTGCTYPFTSIQPNTEPQEPWAPVAARIVSSDGTAATEQTWHYSQQGGTSFSETDPLGNSTVSSFTSIGITCPPAPSEIDFKKPNGTLVKQIINTVAIDSSSYDDPYVNPNGPARCDNPRVTQTKTVLSDTNQQSLTTFNFGTFGNITDKYEYDWGNGGPGSLIRHQVLTYLHDSNGATYGDLAAHILDRVNSSIIYAPDGTTILSKTTTAYDSPAPAGTTNIIQHDYITYPSTNTARGNPTQVNQWLNTSNSWITTTNTYNDVGNLIQLSDANLNNTTLTYTDNYANGTPTQPTAAFVTQIAFPATGGINHIERYQYYLNTGLLAAHCSENFPSGTTCAAGLAGTQPDYESYAYDWRGRLLTHNAGDGGQIVMTYNEAALPITVASATKIDASHNIAQSAVYDGLGRPVQTQLTSDPSGTTYQLMTYDALGRKSQIFNPTRCNPPGTNCGEATWGFTSLAYDSVGRVTGTTSQDGGVVKAVFIGNTTVTTDQSGNQRQSVTDALGRVIEVDEPGTQPPPQSNYATMQTDGNFVLYNSGNQSLWSTQTAGTNAQSIMMQDDGNLVLYIFKWSAGTYAAPTPGSYPASTCSIGNYLIAGQTLPSGKCIVSPHGQYFLYMAPDGNLYIYDWAHGVGTWGPGTQGHPGAYAILQTDGNFVVYDVNNVALWSSGTAGTYAERLDMEDDGRIIIYKSAWNSGTSTGQFNWNQLPHPGCDVGTGTGWTGVLGTGSCFVSPNGHFELLLQSDGNLVLNDLGAAPANMLWSTNTAITPFSPGYSFITKYIYDGLGNLTCIEQHGNDPNGTGCAAPASSDANSTWRVRRFTYDTLSRLVNFSLPESNTATSGTSLVRVNTTYTYDANGNLLQETSPAVNQTGTATQTISYCYDARNRLTSKKYAQQSCPLTSPAATYLYDQTSFNGLTITNGIGRRTGMTDPAGSEAWSFDLMGRAATDKRSIGSVSKTTSYVYNFLGDPTSIVYPGGRTISYTYNNADQPVSAADTANSINYATLATYSPAGALSSLKNGTNLTSSFYLNSRLQPCRMFVTTGASEPANCGDLDTIGNIMDFTYGFNLAVGDNGNVISISNNRDSARSQSFGYDLLNRIATAQTNSTTGTKCFGESFGYDAWGNLLTIGGVTGYSGCTQESLGVAANGKNQISTTGYDAAGNMTTGGYTYDAEDHMLTAGGVTYTYDGDGRRVQKSNGKLYWFGMGSNVLDETDSTGSTTNSAFNEYIFFGGKRIARRDSANTVFYYFADHLATSRIQAQSGQTAPCYDADFYPFGGERTPVVNSCPQNYKYAGMEFDSEDNLNHTEYRQYASSQGRWLSPDPYSGSMDLSNPQSLNRYPYVLNNPLVMNDPTGLDCVYLSNDGYSIESVDTNSSRRECSGEGSNQGTGGYWVDGTVDHVTVFTNSDDVSLQGHYAGDPKGSTNAYYTMIKATPWEAENIFGDTPTNKPFDLILQAKISSGPQMEAAPPPSALGCGFTAAGNTALHMTPGVGLVLDLGDAAEKGSLKPLIGLPVEGAEKGLEHASTSRAAQGAVKSALGTAGEKVSLKAAGKVLGKAGKLAGLAGIALSIKYDGIDKYNECVHH